MSHIFTISLAETANRAETEQRQDATKKNQLCQILFLYYKEGLVSSNLNSKIFRFHSAHSIVGVYLQLTDQYSHTQFIIGRSQRSDSRHGNF